MTGVRIASLLTTTPSSVPAAQVPVSPTAITFRAALASLYEKSSSESGSMESDSNPDSAAGVASDTSSKQEAAQTSPIISNTAASQTATIQHANRRMAWAVGWSNGQINVNSPSASNTRSLTTTAPPALVTLAKGSYWNATSTMGDMQIASAATTTSSSISAAPLAVSPTTIAFQAIPASFPAMVNKEGSSTEKGTAPASSVSAASPKEGQQKTTQPLPTVSNVVARTTTTTPSANQLATAWAAYKSSGQPKISSPIANNTSAPTATAVQPANQYTSAWFTNNSSAQTMISSPIADDTIARTVSSTPSVNQPTIPWTANRSISQTKVSSSIASNLGVRATSSAPTADQLDTAWAANKSSRQATINPPIAGNTSVNTLATSPSAEINGRSWQTPRTMPGAPLASTPAMQLSSTPATQLPVNSSSTTFQPAPMKSSTKAHAEYSSANSASQSQADSSATSHIVSQQQTAQTTAVPVNANVLTTAYAVPSDQPAAAASNSLSGQQTVNRLDDGSSRTFAQSSEVSTPTNEQNLPQQVLYHQPPADPTERTVVVADSSARDATRARQTNPAPSSNGSVAQVVQSGTPAITNATSLTDANVAAKVAGENLASSIVLPDLTTLPSNRNSNQATDKATANVSNGPSGIKNSDLGVATDTEKSKSADSTSTSNDASSHATQNSSQSIQHSQADPSQAAAIVVKTIDNGVSQVQSTVMHTISHEAATIPRGADGSEDASRQTLQRADQASNEMDGSDTTATSGINAAKLIHTIGETGMNVGMRSSEFGNISIRTSVSPQQMTAQISLDHGDLSQALSSHVSSVQSKLENDYGLHTVIEVNHQGAASSGESGNSAPREQKDFVRSAPVANTAAAVEPDVDLGPGAPVGASNGLRLDIRA